MASAYQGDSVKGHEGVHRLLSGDGFHYCGAEPGEGSLNGVVHIFHFRWESNDVSKVLWVGFALCARRNRNDLGYFGHGRRRRRGMICGLRCVCTGAKKYGT